LARDLLGRCIVRRFEDASRIVLRIVETEAYLGAIDRASHAYGNRQTRRTQTLYRAGGCWYVYLIYGMYHCLNVVAHRESSGQAVLIRAGEVIEGVDRALRNRPQRNPATPGAIAGGPGKLCQALAIDKRFDSCAVWNGELQLTTGARIDDDAIVTGPRVGIEYAGEAVSWPLRFAIRGHRDMSRPRLL
jgi:DNA-3-methyladenine glycosylase